MTTLYWYATLTPRHGIPTVRELEADGWTRSKPHPWYKDTWFMKKVIEDEPIECEGCPLYDAPGPVAGSGPPDASICFVGEAPASDEIASGLPFTGGAGRVLSVLVRKAGGDRNYCWIRNSVRCQVPGNDMGSYEHAEAAIQHCSENFLIPELEESPHVKVVVPLGNSANWILTRRGKVGEGIYNFRGYPYVDPVYKFIVLPTIHPAALMRDRTMFNVVVTDLRKAFRIANEGYNAHRRSSKSPQLPSRLRRLSKRSFRRRCP